MIIGYRRITSKIGLSFFESGQRGSWVEKRIGLINFLKSKNIEINYLSSFTSQSQHIKQSEGKIDVLLLEFSGNNLNFYEKDYNHTLKLIEKHNGKIIFVCDDPDLPFLWKLLKNEDFSRWDIWINAKNKEKAREILKIPDKCQVYDIPFHQFLKPTNQSNYKIKKIIYIGNNTGRKKIFQELINSPNLIISGREKEWQDYNVQITLMPDQKDRKQFYKLFFASLCVNDTKHLDSKWRTGRFYHGLYSGLPILTVKNYSSVNGYEIENFKDLDNFTTISDEYRLKIWQKQIDYATQDKGDLDKIL